MLYYILYPLRDIWFGFNVFKYITFRAAMAFVTAFFISVFFGPPVIGWLKKINFGQNIRREYVESLYDLHKHKQGTPTMGGILIIIAITMSTLLWAEIANRYVLVVLASFLWLGFVGFADDYIKVAKKRNLGLRAGTKLLSQVSLGLLLSAYIVNCTPISTELSLPFVKHMALNIGFFYVLFVVIVITSSSNAVNLTD